MSPPEKTLKYFFLEVAGGEVLYLKWREPRLLEPDAPHRFIETMRPEKHRKGFLIVSERGWAVR